MTTGQPSLPPSLTPLTGDDERLAPASPVRGPRPSRRDERRIERAERAKLIERARLDAEARERAEDGVDDRSGLATGRRGRTRSIRTRRVPATVLMVFSRQLASFMEAGISVIEALEVVGAETTSDAMRAVIADVRAGNRGAPPWLKAGPAGAPGFPPGRPARMETGAPRRDPNSPIRPV